MQDRINAEQGECRTGLIQNKMYAGQDVRRTGFMQARIHAGHLHEEQDGIRTGLKEINMGV